MNKDYKKLGKFILVLLLLLAALILANNDMLPSVRISDGDNSAYDIVGGNAGIDFEEEEEEEDNVRSAPSYKAMDDDKLIEIKKNVH
ncbi:MAG: hypothetical protein ACI3ZB_03455 [Prevotella sp.]